VFIFICFLSESDTLIDLIKERSERSLTSLFEKSYDFLSKMKKLI